MDFNWIKVSLKLHDVFFMKGRKSNEASKFIFWWAGNDKVKDNSLSQYNLFLLSDSSRCPWTIIKTMTKGCESSPSSPLGNRAAPTQWGRQIHSKQQGNGAQQVVAGHHREVLKASSSEGSPPGANARNCWVAKGEMLVVSQRQKLLRRNTCPLV